MPFQLKTYLESEKKNTIRYQWYTLKKRTSGCFFDGYFKGPLAKDTIKLREQVEAGQKYSEVQEDLLNRRTI